MNDGVVRFVDLFFSSGILSDDSHNSEDSSERFCLGVNTEGSKCKKSLETVLGLDDPYG